MKEQKPNLIAIFLTFYLINIGGLYAYCSFSTNIFHGITEKFIQVHQKRIQSLEELDKRRQEISAEIEELMPDKDIMVSQPKWGLILQELGTTVTSGMKLTRIEIKKEKNPKEVIVSGVIFETAENPDDELTKYLNNLQSSRYFKDVAVANYRKQEDLSFDIDFRLKQRSQVTACHEQFDKTEEYFEDNLKSDLKRLAYAYNVLGVFCAKEQRYIEAMGHYKKSLDIITVV